MGFLGQISHLMEVPLAERAMRSEGSLPVQVDRVDSLNNV